MPRIHVEALGTLASVARREGDLRSAAQFERQGADLAGASGFVWWQTNALANVAETYQNAPRRPRP
jgi:hypothetical protein